MAVSCTSDGRNYKLQRYDLATGDVKTLLSTNNTYYGLNPLAISSDGTTLVTTHSTIGGAELALWNLASGEHIQRYIAHQGRVLAACLSGDGTRVIVAADDRTVRIFGRHSPEPLDQIDLGTLADMPAVLRLAPGDKAFYVGTARGVVLQFELR